MKKCHLHTKPQKKCKFCMRYERDLSAAHADIDTVTAQLDAQTHALGMKLMQNVGLIGADPAAAGMGGSSSSSAAGAAGALGLGFVIQKDDAQQYTGNTTTNNFSPILHGQVMKSAFFKVLCNSDQFPSVTEVIVEATDKCNSCDIYTQGSFSDPSTFMCILFRLMTMKPNTKELKGMLNNTESVYVRLVGFMLIRYGFYADFDKLWKWYEPYLLDEEKIPDMRMKVGEYVERLIMDDKYGDSDGGVLPRLAIK